MWLVKRYIYPSCLASFTMANKSTNAWSFGFHLLPLLDIFVFYVTQFGVYIFLSPRINIMTV